MNDERITRALRSLREPPMPGDPGAIWLRARLDEIAGRNARMRAANRLAGVLQVLGLDAVAFVVVWTTVPNAALAAAAAALTHSVALALRSWTLTR